MLGSQCRFLISGFLGYCSKQRLVGVWASFLVPDSRPGSYTLSSFHFQHYRHFSPKHMQWGYLLVFDGASFDIAIGRWDSCGESVRVRYLMSRNYYILSFVLQFSKPVKPMWWVLYSSDSGNWLTFPNSIDQFPQSHPVSVKMVITLCSGKSQISALSLNNLKDNCLWPPGHLGLDVELA